MLSLIHTFYSSLQHTLSLLSLLCLHQLPGNSFHVQQLLSLLPGVYLITRLGVAMQKLTMMGSSSASHASIRSNCLTTTSDSDWSLCPQTLSRLWTDWLVPLVLVILPQDGPNKNTASHNSSIVALCHYWCRHREHRSKWYFHWLSCMAWCTALLCHCLLCHNPVTNVSSD
jgi:hypothetical protein